MELVVYGTPFVTAGILGSLVKVLAVLGLLWAPFAAFTAARTARSQGLPAGRFALVGGIYSVLFIAPWWFLMLTMRGKHLHGGRVTVVFVLLHAAWLIGLFGLALIGAIVVWAAEIFAWPDGLSTGANDLRVLFVFNAIAIGVSWGSSLFVTAKLPAVEISKNATIQIRYVLPFVLCYISMILSEVTNAIGKTL